MSAAAFHNTTKAAVALGGLGVAAVSASAWASGGGLATLIVSFGALLCIWAVHRSSGSLASLAGEAAPAELVLLVRDLAGRAGLPPPKVVVSGRAMPNAYASGRSPSHAVVLVTRGLLGTMARPELEGALAHELMHVRRRDLPMTALTASLAIVGAGALGWSRPPGSIVTLVAAPAVALLGQLALCRRRELAADREAALLLGAAEPLARALRAADTSSVHGHRLARLLSTHPDSSDRVRRLRSARVA